MWHLCVFGRCPQVTMSWSSRLWDRCWQVSGLLRAAAYTACCRHAPNVWQMHFITLFPLYPQVLFKMVLGSAKFGEAALFLSIVGSANFVFISFVPVILYFTHVEYIASLADIPWVYLCGVAGLLFGMRTGHPIPFHSVCYCTDHTNHKKYFALCCRLMLFLPTAFNVLVNFGIAITYPTLISLGIVLSVPVNASKSIHGFTIY